MTPKAYKAAIAIALTLSLTPPLASGAEVENPEIWASQSLTATQRSQNWQSPVLFGPRATVYVSVKVGEEALSSEQLYGCLMFFRGFGLHVRVNLCGQALVPIRLRYHSTGRKRFPFHVVYEMESVEAMTESVEAELAAESSGSAP